MGGLIGASFIGYECGINSVIEPPEALIARLKLAHEVDLVADAGQVAAVLGEPVGGEVTGTLAQPFPAAGGGKDRLPLEIAEEQDAPSGESSLDDEVKDVEVALL